MDVHDNESMDTFSAKATIAIAKHNGRLMIKNPSPDVKVGEKRGLLLMVEFQHRQSSGEFYQSNEYQKAAEGQGELEGQPKVEGQPELETFSTSFSFMIEGASNYPSRRETGYVLMYIHKSDAYRKAMVDGAMASLTTTVENAVQTHYGKVILAPFSTDGRKARPLDVRQGGSNNVGTVFCGQFRTVQHANDFYETAEWKEVMAAKDALGVTADVYVVEGVGVDRLPPNHSQNRHPVPPAIAEDIELREN